MSRDCRSSGALRRFVEGNPLKNIDVLGGQGDNLSLIMKGGAIVKDELGKAA
ncbi:MAG: hypothetical protein HC869_00620 [Rhodospirillales bacterium]|nr:hypothetical protein [Rhodospirillales bacterium]